MYRDIETKIENTTMKERYNDNNELINYVISPVDGYVLHAKSRDEIILDENGNETGKVKLGYTRGIVTALVNYDFEENPREIYAVKEEEYNKFYEETEGDENEGA